MSFRMLYKWFKFCGFDIFGEGFVYVLSVAKGSIVFYVGFSLGDEIIELDGEDVINVSVIIFKFLVKYSRF